MCKESTFGAYRRKRVRGLIFHTEDYYYIYQEKNRNLIERLKKYKLSNYSRCFAKKNRKRQKENAVVHNANIYSKINVSVELHKYISFLFFIFCFFGVSLLAVTLRRFKQKGNH